MKVQVERLLPHVRRPGNYLGNEVNSVHKDHGAVRVKVALAYPDRYEIGMSNLGVRIVYHLLNKFPEIACERFFAPWPDMETLLRKNGVPLFALESGVPIGDFDVVAFSIGYELTYTNILNMLDLSGLPVLSADRSEGHPIVIGGGACCLNPEPLADFFDCFFIGDGEQTVKEMAGVLLGTKKAGASRMETLRALSEIPGSYVPSFGTPESVTRRISRKLEMEDFPCQPVVPYSEITHDRLAIEIMRGCPRFCKFCQSALMYAPVRRRAPSDVLELAEKGLETSGWEEMSLVSLSPTDYPGLPELLRKLEGLLEKTRTSLSLSSLRADGLTDELGSALGMVKKASVTVAPEAGTERLRSVIGKAMPQESILQSARTAFGRGFGRVKLYFMIGLPGETDEDVDAIIDLAMAVSGEAKGGQTKVSISGFVPKAHTPFEREAQQSVEELHEKAKYLRTELKRRRIDASSHDPQVSFLEAVMSRGDRKLSRAILSAFNKGCRFDGWSEQFDYRKWMSSFEESGIDPHSYTDRIPEDEEVPWSFIKMESHAHEQVSRPGVAPESRAPEREFGRQQRRTTQRSPYQVGRYRVKYTKLGDVRFISHLDVMRTMVRVLRRAGVPLAYSQGFSTRPKVSFGPPLSVGMTSACEYFDFMIERPFAGDLRMSIASQAPGGMDIAAVTPVFVRSKSLSEILDVAEYRVRDIDLPEGLIEEFMSKDACIVDQVRGEKHRIIDVRPLLVDLKPEDGGLRIKIRMRKTGWVGPREILSAMKGLSPEELADLDIERVGLYSYKGGVLIAPTGDSETNA